MVNFNFGLGGLMGDKKDEDKTDEAVVAGNTSDDGSTQDDSSAPITTDDTSAQVLTEKTTTEVSEENIAEPVESIAEETAETSNEPVFEIEKNQSTETATENPAESGLQTMDSEEDWLKDASAANEAPISLETETPEMPTFGETPATESITDLSAPAPENEIVEENIVEESNPFPEAATPEITEEVTTEEVAEITPQETTLFAENTEAESVSTPVENVSAPITPLIPAIPKMETPVAETPEAISAEETKIAEIPAKTETNTENVSANIPEIPTFEIPKKTETTTDSIVETSTEIPAKIENEKPAEDLFAPSSSTANEITADDSFLDSTTSEDSVNNSSDDLFATTNTETADKSTFDNDFAGIDPLAPAALATIGTIEKEETDESTENFFGDNSGDNNKIAETEAEEIPAKKDTIKPVETLLELKNGITEFVETHNSKIADYKSQISELNKKIREERHILKEEQKKSAKILADLNELVAGFSTTTSIKKKRIKKINNKKAA